MTVVHPSSLSLHSLSFILTSYFYSLIIIGIIQTRVQPVGTARVFKARPLARRMA